MTLLEAIKTQADIAVYADESETNPGKVVYYWDINCGYQSWGSALKYDTPQEAWDALEQFLKTWKGPTK